MSSITRPSGRATDALRTLSFSRGYTKHAEGSVLVAMGDTRVLCTASVLDRLPPHKKGSGEGWVTAEYGMLPRSTHTRSDREAARGKQSGRTQEIQRLIGRSLRAVVDLKKLGERTLHIDCDVLQADGGTRCASICGAYVAVADAVAGLLREERARHGGAVARAVLHAQLDALRDALFDETLGKSAHVGRLLRIALGVEGALMVVQVGVDVDKVEIFRALLGVGLQLLVVAHGTAFKAPSGAAADAGVW